MASVIDSQANTMFRKLVSCTKKIQKHRQEPKQTQSAHDKTPQKLHSYLIEGDGALLCTSACPFATASRFSCLPPFCSFRPRSLCPIFRLDSPSSAAMCVCSQLVRGTQPPAGVQPRFHTRRDRIIDREDFERSTTYRYEKRNRQKDTNLKKISYDGESPLNIINNYF